MNCDDYRQAVGADPAFDDDHAAACAECRAWRDELRALDGEIRQALALDVPALSLPELPDVDTSSVTPLPRRRRTAPAWFALAATVAVAAIVGVRMAGDGGARATLGEQVLAHVDHEAAASLVVTDAAVPDAELAAVLPADVSTLRHGAGLVTYARSCEINGRPVPHLVVQGRRGPVTILLMPEEHVDEAVTLSGEHVNGVILPVGDGSIAIIGGRDEPLDAIRREVLDSVTWTT